jgi:hypothetical protein
LVAHRKQFGFDFSLHGRKSRTSDKVAQRTKPSLKAADAATDLHPRRQQTIGMVLSSAKWKK